MSWRVIRLELAPCREFPNGSAGRAYLIRLPLCDDGRIDLTKLEAEPGRATVRRFWANQEDRFGLVVLHASALSIEFEAGEGSPSRRFGLSFEAIRIGDRVVLPEPDGCELEFRVTALA